MGQALCSKSKNSLKDEAISTTSKNSLKCVEWMWQANPNPWSDSEPATWNHYSDVENLIIERAYSNKEPRATLDDYYIDFNENRLISNTDDYKPRPVKRVVRKREDKHLREERFVDLPVSTGRLFGGEYGWVSPFIIEVRRYLKLEPEELPSKKTEMIPTLIEKAAQGIIQEGKLIRKEEEAKELANMLRKQKDNGIKQVWQCCAYIYSLESFLYKTLNATMRLVGDKEHEHVWRSKIRTLGPFCLLLWDDPCNKKAKTNEILYRAANLNEQQIAKYEEMANNPDEYGSFQAFTSCSRNRQKAAEFGNTLFIMKVVVGFTADLVESSEYPFEEEELVTPGVSFRVTKVEFDHKINKHLIHFELRQRFSSKSK
ncbi:unnamed protein product [Rotaria sordida]|uniref:NAD(P)(+)--arginine ADP-ribosyltransferase n=1 Tax=Rotaria sordida TaxID=392033 RepID=A0A815RHU8_9BILA|nr:unnamed protein product [Rotaria sordida]CAF1258867.1 unnamed protein product [Rotaria sordida]CAF1477294.1 unnamed protein product [Rotaria sordida]